MILIAHFGLTMKKLEKITHNVQVYVAACVAPAAS